MTRFSFRFLDFRKRRTDQIVEFSRAKKSQTDRILGTRIAYLTFDHPSPHTSNSPGSIFWRGIRWVMPKARFNFLERRQVGHAKRSYESRESFASNPRKTTSLFVLGS